MIPVCASAIYFSKDGVNMIFDCFGFGARARLICINMKAAATPSSRQTIVFSHGEL